MPGRACLGRYPWRLLRHGCDRTALLHAGAVAYAAVPDSVLKPAMALPMHLYLLVAQGETSMGSAYGTAFVMMALILICNLLASIYAGRSHKR